MKNIVTIFIGILLANVLIHADMPVLDENKITWKNLGFGIHNPAEITDWTHYGIKTADEASLWIDALKPLGGISYAGAARIWKQNGFSANEAKGWVLIGAKTPERVRYWTNVGIKNAEEAQKWKDAGFATAQQVAEWIHAGINSVTEVQQWQEIGIYNVNSCKDWKSYVDNPNKAKEWMDASYSLDDVARQVAKGYLSPSDVVTEEETSNHKGSKQFTTTSTTQYTNVDVLKDNTKDLMASNHSYEQPVNNTETMPTEYNTTSNGDAWQLFILVYFIVMIVTMFKGYGENRTVIIFRDYNDLGLTFLIPASFVLIFYLFMMFGGKPSWGMGLALVVSVSLFVILVKNTYEDNNKAMLPTVLSIMTKVPLGIIWIMNFITMLNPSGKTASKRRKSRGTALVILAILTPIIGMLVVEKEGSLFNPRDWIKGKRIGSIRNHL